MKASIVVAVSPPIPYSLKLFPQIPSLLGVWPDMSKLPKITSLLFLCNILKKT